MNNKIKEDLISIVGQDWTISDLEKIKGYLYDETPEPVVPKATEDVIVVKPKNESEISQILKLANEENFPVIPRGAGTGLCGGAIPTEPSVILSLERLGDILELDEANLSITCEAGVTLEEVFGAVEESEDLFFPPHPGDEGAQIGGLVVENAGGARAVKYGVMRNFVLGIKIVLPTGEIIDLGGKVLKDNTGYDLKQLIIGSEGTLGIVTQVTLRLYPSPEEDATLLIPFERRQEAIESVPKLLRTGAMPLAIEYVEKEHIDKSAEHLGEKWPASQGKAHLILIIEGQSQEELYSKAERISQVCEENNALNILMAERHKEQEKILDIRSNLYSTYQPEMAEDLDIAVPPAELAEMLETIDQVEKEHDISIPTWGHAGDGNLHLHIMKKEERVPENLETVKETLYKSAIGMGGVITGEHGVGKTRVKNLPLNFSEKEIELMRQIKNVFDPQGILNPSTLV